MIVLILITLAMPIASDAVSWIASGTRIENPAVLSLVLNPDDLDTAISAMVALTKRSDQYVEDIIAPLLDQQSSHHELLLEVHLLAVWRVGGLDPWVGVNPDAAERLMNRLPYFHSAYLRGAVLSIGRWLNQADRDSHILSEAHRLSMDLRDPNPPPGLLFVLERLLETASVLKVPEIAPVLLEISRELRHPDLSQRTRLVARKLLLGEDPSD